MKSEVGRRRSIYTRVAYASFNALFGFRTFFIKADLVSIYRRCILSAHGIFYDTLTHTKYKSHSDAFLQSYGFLLIFDNFSYYFRCFSIAFSAILIPSVAEETIPPA